MKDRKEIYRQHRVTVGQVCPCSYWNQFNFKTNKQDHMNDYKQS